ncbi:MAG: tRNA (guanosine(37)-N1)-methyltransferase TrmD, partial [Pseudomonadota bacterium]
MTSENHHPWRASVLTIFPEMFPGPLGQSLPGKALENGLWTLETLDIRSFARDKHATVDDTPFGGGPGMVMRPDVVDAALTSVMQDEPAADGRAKRPAIYLTPRGRPFDQTLAAEWAAGPGVVFLCGRYEGVDQRVLDAHELDEVSIGDFVLAGGEIAAMTILEAAV